MPAIHAVARHHKKIGVFNLDFERSIRNDDFVERTMTGYKD
jgi:hypothetical protein